MNHVGLYKLVSIEEKKYYEICKLCGVHCIISQYYAIKKLESCSYMIWFQKYLKGHEFLNVMYYFNSIKIDRNSVQCFAFSSNY